MNGYPPPGELSQECQASCAFERSQPGWTPCGGLCQLRRDELIAERIESER